MSTKPVPTVAEQMAAQERRFCVHFNGTMSCMCKAGVVYDDVMVNDAPPGKKMPCDRNGPDTCDKRRFPTEEEVQATVAEHLAGTTRSLTALAAVIKEVGTRRGIKGQIKCPNCEEGQVHYSVAHTNGHIWGKCTTPGCASWVQ